MASLPASHPQVAACHQSLEVLANWSGRRVDHDVLKLPAHLGGLTLVDHPEWERSIPPPSRRASIQVAINHEPRVLAHADQDPEACRGGSLRGSMPSYERDRCDRWATGRDESRAAAA